jgi:uncharacterized membrane protein YeaQ/YmgE (transglycosylase-associated protein family)
VVNFIVWIVVGGVLGWLASIIMNRDAEQGILLNVIVGIVGAFLAGLVLSPLFGVPTINQGGFSLPALLISLVGAVILLGIVNLVRRGTVR